MLNKIIENINNSNLDLKEKQNLIDVATTIYRNNCPVLLDKKQTKLLFQMKEDIKLFSFMKDNTLSHTIEKRNGEPRIIYKPSMELKEIQRWILTKILRNITDSENTHGFVKDRSILTHARNHVHPEPFWMVTFDIKNFFPSIKHESVYQIFRNIGYNEEVSLVLSELCTMDGNVVQGFPTSPKISNIVMKYADEIFIEYCRVRNLKFSRYADDISFSGIGNFISKEIFEDIHKTVTETLGDMGFSINTNKTKKFANSDPKKITGLMISENGVKVPGKIKKMLAKEIYYCKKFGVESHLIRTNKITLANYKGYMYGLAGYIRMVELEVGNQFFEELEKIYWG